MIKGFAEDKGISQVQPGDSVRLAVEGPTAHLFDADGLAYHARQ